MFVSHIIEAKMHMNIATTSLGQRQD